VRIDMYSLETWLETVAAVFAGVALANAFFWYRGPR
jgi:hypothetical protein